MDIEILDLPGELAGCRMLGFPVQRYARMPRPIDNLRADHLLVAKALEVLEAVADHVRGDGSFPADDCALVLRFLREFLLPVHFRKENELVWPALTMRGDERTAAQIGDLLRQQDQVTELVHTLVLFWEPAGELTTSEREGFAATATTLAGQLRRLHQCEERKLFRACDRAVPADDQLEWVAGFASIDAECRLRCEWATCIERLAADWLH